MVDLSKTLLIARAGMKVESERIRVVSENIANADSIAEYPGAAPYRRKTLTFKNQLDKNLGVETVKVSKYGYDNSDYQYKYEPNNPVASADGYVAYPNVDIITERADLLQAQRTYEANLGVLDTTKTMLSKTVALIK